MLYKRENVNINEMINELIEWNKNYPNYCPTKIIDLHSLPIEIQDEFKKMQSYYTYLRDKKREGKLSEEQISKCKEGDIRGVFGYPERVEKLAREYRQRKDMIHRVLSQYESFNKFVEHELEVKSNIVRNFYEINLKSNIGIENLFRDMYNWHPDSGSLVYNCDTVIEEINKLPEIYKNLLMKSYDINGKGKTRFRKAEIELGIAPKTSHEKRRKAFKILRKNLINRIIRIPDFEKIGEEDRQKIIDALGNYVFYPSSEYENEPFKYNRESLKKLVDICKEIKKYKTSCLSDEEKEKIDIEEEIKELQEQEKEMPIEDFQFTIRVFNALKRRYINSIQEVIDIDEEGTLYKIKLIGEKGIKEIKEKISLYKHVLKIYNEEEKKNKNNKHNKKSFVSAEQEGDSILKEGELKKKGGISDSSNPKEEAERIENEKKKSELKMLRETRDQLLEEYNMLQHKFKRVKELYDSYDSLKDENHNLDDK